MRCPEQAVKDFMRPRSGYALPLYSLQILQDYAQRLHNAFLQDSEKVERSPPAQIL